MKRKNLQLIRLAFCVACLQIGAYIYAQSADEGSIDVSDSIQDRPRSTARGFGASSLLDDLLKPPSPTQATEPVVQSLENMPLVESSGSSLADQLAVVLQQMQAAAEQLDAPKLQNDSKLDALESQNRAIEELEKILISVERKASASQSASSDRQPESVPKQSNRPKDAESTLSPSEDNSQSQPGTNQNGAKPDPSNKSTEEQEASNPDSTSSELHNPNPQSNSVVSGLPTGETIVDLIDSIEQSGRANWGKLPQRLREKMSSSKSLTIPKGYEQTVQDYYKYLNESVRN